MSVTPYSRENQAFSDLAHSIAQSQIYPYVFNCNQQDMALECVSVSTGERGKILDGQMGVDRVIRVKYGFFQSPFTHTVQERFRHVKFLENRDLTITEWNNRSDLPSELYKINAGIFVYGYFDEVTKTIPCWVAIDTTKMILLLSTRQLRFSTHENFRSGQEFLVIKFKDLYEQGCMIAGYDEEKNIYENYWIPSARKQAISLLTTLQEAWAKQS